MLKKEPRTMFSGRSIVFESGGRGADSSKNSWQAKKKPLPPMLHPWFLLKWALGPLYKNISIRYCNAVTISKCISNNGLPFGAR